MTKKPNVSSFCWQKKPSDTRTKRFKSEFLETEFSHVFTRAGECIDDLNVLWKQTKVLYANKYQSV